VVREQPAPFAGACSAAVPSAAAATACSCQPPGQRGVEPGAAHEACSPRQQPAPSSEAPPRSSPLERRAAQAADVSGGVAKSPPGVPAGAHARLPVTQRRVSASGSSTPPSGGGGQSAAGSLSSQVRGGRSRRCIPGHWSHMHGPVATRHSMRLDASHTAAAVRTSRLRKAATAPAPGCGSACLLQQGSGARPSPHPHHLHKTTAFNEQRVKQLGMLARRLAPWVSRSAPAIATSVGDHAAGDLLQGARRGVRPSHAAGPGPLAADKTSPLPCLLRLISACLPGPWRHAPAGGARCAGPCAAGARGSHPARRARPRAGRQAGAGPLLLQPKHRQVRAEPHQITGPADSSSCSRRRRWRQQSCRNRLVTASPCPGAAADYSGQASHHTSC